jgi:hypothetical protein
MKPIMSHHFGAQAFDGEQGMGTAFCQGLCMCYARKLLLILSQNIECFAFWAWFPFCQGLLGIAFPSTKLAVPVVQPQMVAVHFMVPLN